jgi:hypothetical protein
MPSRVALEIARRRRERIARMTPAERVDLALGLGRRGLASFMAVHGLDRETARARIEATRRAGRRPSRSAGGA